MAQAFTTTLIANATVTIPLLNHRGVRNIYSVYAGGTYGGGTLTATLVPATGMTGIAIKDQSGNAISYTSDGMFNFEAQSDPKSPAVLNLVLVSATSPSIKIIVNDGR